LLLGIITAKTVAMRFFSKILIGVLALAGLVFPVMSSSAITVSQLRNISKLTPETFASYFADFEFKFHDEVQNHQKFLASKSGDCDDYATLAADILGRNGYTPRLIAVRMKGETHVVCYIKETKSYLDYNCRKDDKKTVSCSESINEIARKVAQSFGRDWIATYQFTFSEGVKRLVQNIVPNPSSSKTS
jgi:hypothetical protein